MVTMETHHPGRPGWRKGVDGHWKWSFGETTKQAITSGPADGLSVTGSLCPCKWACAVFHSGKKQPCRSLDFVGPHAGGALTANPVAASTFASWGPNCMGPALGSSKDSAGSLAVEPHLLVRWLCGLSPWRVWFPWISQAQPGPRLSHRPQKHPILWETWSDCPIWCLGSASQGNKFLRSQGNKFLLHHLSSGKGSKCAILNVFLYRRLIMLFNSIIL